MLPSRAEMAYELTKAMILAGLHKNGIVDVAFDVTDEILNRCTSGPKAGVLPLTDRAMRALYVWAQMPNAEHGDVICKARSHCQDEDFFHKLACQRGCGRQTLAELAQFFGFDRYDVLINSGAGVN